MTARRVSLLAPALVVGVLAGVAPVAYTMLVVQVPSAPPAPVVAFGNVTSDLGGMEILIVAANPTRPTWEFGARLTRDGAVVEELSRLDQSGWTLRFTDQDRDGRLSVGDGFSFQFFMVGHYELRLLWRDASIAVVAWDIVVPELTFAPAQVGGAWVTVDVATATPAAPLGEFTASLMFGWSTTLSWVSPLQETNSSQFSFADRDGNGRLSSGDRFASSYTEMGDYEIQLQWLGQWVATANWTVGFPAVTFSVWQANATVTWLNVTSATNPRPCADYTGSLSLNSSWRDQIVGLCGGASSNGMMRAYDLDADSRLSVGDRITVTVDTRGLWRFASYWQSTYVADVSWIV